MPTAEDNAPIPSPHRSFQVAAWWCLIATQIGVYLAIAWLSTRFAFDSTTSGRPIPLVLGLFSTNFILHLTSLSLALRRPNTWRLAAAILAVSVAFRIVMLGSTPIQEIDIYRYIWDGAVVTQAMSPYQYAPAEVIDAPQQTSSPELRKLVQLRGHTGLDVILRRIHYPELTTIYPPVSTACFGFAVLLTPKSVGPDGWVLAMKAFIVGFDLACVVLLLGILHRTGRKLGWSIAYAWSPLVMKEFANSGHLDSIAVCFSLAAIVALLPRVGSDHRIPTVSRTLLSSLCLSLAVGAKLYPVILLPAFFVYLVGKAGWLRATQFACATVCMSFIILAPMLFPLARTDTESTLPLTEAPPLPLETANANDAEDTMSPEASQSSVTRPGSGLTTFLSRWEMNDLLFMIAHENLRPRKVGAFTPWFVVSANETRLHVCQMIAPYLPTGMEPAFFLARIVTLIPFGLVVLGSAWRIYREPTYDRWLEGMFLTLAWFWLLSPTQNPWYWTWALPLVAFARGRSWLLVGGLALIYYLRFWFLYEFTAVEVVPGYVGTNFFDFVLVWFEFGPFLVLLLCSWLIHRLGTGRSTGEAT